VHDFVFVAAPGLVATDEPFDDAEGTVRVRVLAPPERAWASPRHLSAARAGLAVLGERLGPYPYSQLTVVQVPRGAEGAGGMEYPTLIFTGDGPPLSAFHLAEFVTAHELCHQYFYGMLASDEVEEAWLDEGLTEYASGWVLERLFGGARGIYDLVSHRLSHAQISHLSYLARPDVDRITTRSFDFADFQSYGAITYSKTALALDTLRGAAGDGPFYAGLKRYFEAWRFRHPRDADFRAALVEGARASDPAAAGALDRLMPPLFDSTTTFDDEVADVVVRNARSPGGLVSVDGGGADGGAREREGRDLPDRFVSEVLLRRRGELPLATDVVVRFDDGSERKESWPPDGRAWRRFTYEGPRKVVAAEIDPLHRRAIDLEQLNDARLATPDRGPRHALLAKLAQLLFGLLSVLT
jgi:hypothetical protein